MKSKTTIEKELTKLHKKWAKKPTTIKNILNCTGDIISVSEKLMDLLPEEMRQSNEVDGVIPVMVTNIPPKKML